jgi:tetratricopeptide (TPR) repeat protein
MRHARKITVAALVFTSSLAAAETAAPSGSTPLFDYANSQPVISRPFDGALRKQIATFEAEMARHPPPPDAECAHTLGASRFARMYDDLGSAQANAGDYAAAIEAFEKALACTPRVTNIHAQLASELLHAHRLAEARATAVRALAIDSENAALDSVLMQIDFVEERWADTVARLRPMIVAQTDDERATYYLCFLWLAQRRAGEKDPDLTSRTVQYEDWPEPILETLRGQQSEAQLLEIVLEEQNELRRREILAEALYYVGQARLANGERETARRYFATVVNLKVVYFIEHHMALAEILKMQDQEGS